MSPWTFAALSLYPEMFPGPIGLSLAGRALQNGIWQLCVTNMRDYTSDKHRTVDDTPAGGGPGMVMRADVVAAAIDDVSLRYPGLTKIYFTPRGAPLTQSKVREFAASKGILAVCGRFEGLDQRVIEARNLTEICIGDYILSGGELAAMVLCDACVRLLPGVVGDEASLYQESFESGLLEHSHYTKPRVWEGRTIPDVLLSGDHKRINEWRQENALSATQTRRPDLLEKKLFSK